jgi:RNA polymerase sigma-B factor
VIGMSRTASDAAVFADVVYTDQQWVDEELSSPSAPLAELSDDDLLARCHRYDRDSPESTAVCEVLVRRFTPLVRACVRPYLSSPEPAEDLMQVGYLGLMKAIRNYDPAFGNGLKAYAMPCISGEIKRHFRDKRWQVRVIRSVQELLLEMRGATEDLTNELGRLPNETELAQRLGVTTGELREARQAAESFAVLSLDARVSDDADSAELGELIGGPDSGFDQATDMEALETHWAELPRREQQILLLRFYGNHTQERGRAAAGDLPDARVPAAGPGPDPAARAAPRSRRYHTGTR